MGTFGYSPRQAITAAERAEFMRVAVEVAQAAGEVVVPHFRAALTVENKSKAGRFDPVTVADRAAEAVVRRELADRYPDHGVFGEESGFTPGSGLTWVVDPIDGTRGFMTGMLHWGVLLALFDGQSPVVGVIHQPVSEETFWGDGEVARYEGFGGDRVLRVRPCATLADAVLGSTGPEFFHGPRVVEGFDAVRARSLFTRFGGDCYSYAMLAMGQLDVVVEHGLKPYDVQALIPIVRGAGGIISDWDGGDPAMGGNVIAAGDVRVHEEALALLAGR